MKFENFPQASEVVAKISAHRIMVEKLQDGPNIFIMPYNHFDKDRTIINIKPSIDRGPELWCKDFIDKLIADYEDRIATLTVVLDSL